MRSAARADLHLHTVFSDGLARPEDYIRKARLEGFQVISITDHNTFRGSAEAVKFIRREGIREIIVLPGCEVRTNLGDVLVYCPEVPSDEPPRQIEELARWCRVQRCLLVPAHPLDLSRSGIGLLNLLRYNWDAVEVYNGGTVIPLLNELTYVLVRYRLRRPMLGSSDAHSVCMLGSCYTLILDEVSSPEDVLECLRRGLCKPYKRMSYIARVAGKIRQRLSRLGKA